jgi:hypothetical protein
VVILASFNAQRDQRIQEQVLEETNPAMLERVAKNSRKRVHTEEGG